MKIIDNKNTTNFYRILLLSAFMLYAIFAIFYYYSEIQDPMPLNQRFLGMFLFLSVFILSFVNKKIKQSIDHITKIVTYLAIGQLIFISYLSSFNFELSISLLVVITIINLFFEGDKIAFYGNVVLAFIIAVALILVEDTIIFRGGYFTAYISVTALTYFLSYRRFKLKERLENSLQQQEILLNTVDTQIWYLKDEKTYGKVNQCHADFLGLNIEEIEGQKIDIVLSNREAESFKTTSRRVFKEKEKIETEKWVNDSEGKKRLLLITQNPLLNKQNEVEYVVCSANDITERKQIEKRIEYLSYRDSLTGLYNRRFFDEEMKRIDTERQLPISIIMIDVNGLKIINDSLGHEKGDELIIKTANLLEEAVREEDILARYGGDEFLVLLPQTREEKAQDIAKRIKRNCKKTKKGGITVSLALGVATKKTLEEDIKNILEKADNNMYEGKNISSSNRKQEVVEGLLNTLEASSNETIPHVRRMKKLAQKLGDRLALSKSQLQRLSLLSRLHDIGKTYISEDILTKEDVLTGKEWEKIKKHPRKGFKIAIASEEFAVVAEDVISHHEFWNGEGYPRGLEGEEIPLLARIIAIVDAYDVMTSGRSYKEAMSRERALKEIKDCAGSQFDPELAAAFVEMMREDEN